MRGTLKSKVKNQNVTYEQSQHEVTCIIKTKINHIHDRTPYACRVENYLLVGRLIDRF